MLIRYYMTPNPVTIHADVLVPEAKQLLDTHHFRHLPVVDDNDSLVGIITDRDIRSAYPSTLLSEPERNVVYDRVKASKVSSIMSTDFISLRYDSTLDDAVLLFTKRNVGALPVCRNDKVVGIISQTDVMKSLGRLFGLGEKGSVLLSIEAKETTPPLSNLVQILEEHDVPFTRLLKTEGSGSEPAMIYLRVNTFKLPSVHRLVAEAGFSLHLS